MLLLAASTALLVYYMRRRSTFSAAAAPVWLSFPRGMYLTQSTNPSCNALPPPQLSQVGSVLYNCTFTGNSAAVSGGAAHFDACKPDDMTARYSNATAVDYDSSTGLYTLFRPAPASPTMVAANKVGALQRLISTGVVDSRTSLGVYYNHD